jgi:KipI family sensor histidine kinase inhibitor
VTPGWPVIRPLGDAAVLVELGSNVDLAIARRVHALAARVAAATAGETGWGLPVPGACSLLVPVDPVEPGALAAAARLSNLVREALEEPVPDAGTGRDTPILEIPTRYGGPGGPDLDAVAEGTGLTPAGVIERHAAVTYTALFLGFAPGFAYLGPLPPELAVPRRPMPRTLVPIGSVAIAGEQTAVYPIDSPGGWWIIGRTDVRPWDPRREPPALLRPGSRVRFVPESRSR